MGRGAGKLEIKPCCGPDHISWWRGGGRVMEKGGHGIPKNQRLGTSVLGKGEG